MAKYYEPYVVVNAKILKYDERSGFGYNKVMYSMKLYQLKYMIIKL